VFGISFEIIHQGNELVNVFIDRATLPNLEQATKQELVLIPGKAQKQLGTKVRPSEILKLIFHRGQLTFGSAMKMHSGSLNPD
jgi:hypothetical protein